MSHLQAVRIEHKLHINNHCAQMQLRSAVMCMGEGYVGSEACMLAFEIRIGK